MTAANVGETDGRMTLVGHLTELRTRLFRSALAIVVVSIVAFTQYGHVQLWLLDYYRGRWAELGGAPWDEAELIEVYRLCALQ